ncbi:MAG: S1 family peptidase [Gemmataceae bacterium]|nr:S1 family peptidase [Gemmataceae bacterium]
MLLDSARGLKQTLTETVLAPFTAAEPQVKALSMPAGPVAGVSPIQPSIALGIGRKAGHEFQIAVRCQRRELMTGKEVEQIRKKAKDEVEVRYIGPVTKRGVPWTQQRHRPLHIGISVGHVKVTAGTLGAFVKKRSAEDTLILSNNHVLANENRAKTGDAIVQAGTIDDGTDPEDRIATLAGLVRLKKTRPNAIDAALAKLEDAIAFDPRTIRGLGKLAGLGAAFVDEGTEVAKLGRTTGLTRGQVTAFEVDNLVVVFDTGALRFDGQVEIEGGKDEPFSAGGDSGSLIVEAGTRLAVALLFAGTDAGGANNQGVTYANPLRTVLDALKVDLVTA